MHARAIVVSFLAAAASAYAGVAPATLHYQGVLRDAAGAPLDGPRDMLFRFFDAAAAGEEILTDSHIAAGGDAVVVAGGLFAVDLGSGVLADGSGAGTYSTLTEVFRDHGLVFVEIEIEGETLSPRVQIHSAAFALNAASLDGLHAGQFLRSDVADKAMGTVTIEGGLTGFDLGDGLLTLHATGDSLGTVFGVARNGETLLDLDWSGRLHGTQGVFDFDGCGFNFLRAGVRGFSAYWGGQFKDCAGTGSALVGGNGRGVYAVGDEYGVLGRGGVAGGRFGDDDGTGDVWLAYDDIGVDAYGEFYGVRAISEGYAVFAVGATSSATAAGSFSDLDGATRALLANTTYGVAAFGVEAGIRAEDTGSGTVSRLAHGTATVSGNGTKDFVQNHPYDPERTIHYSAPEGGEAATYTRGTARLVDGLTRVRLDETFAWVTNPAVGLTAHLTPRGKAVALAVASVTTEELVVTGPADNDVAFDYLVYGLRIGFEEVPVVRRRDDTEGQIPSMREHRIALASEPELHGFTPLERYRTMERMASGKTTLDLTAASALVAAIGEAAPAADPQPARGQPTRSAPAEADPPLVDVGEKRVRDSDPPTERELRPVSSDTARHRLASAATLPQVTVEGPVRMGDVLVLDPEAPGSVRRAAAPHDPGVVGIAWIEPGDTTLERLPEDAAPRTVGLAVSGIVECNVDAGYGEIRPGDLLTTSPTPGHAMRAADPLPGTLLGKALDGLTTGTGRIRIVTTLH